MDRIEVIKKTLFSLNFRERSLKMVKEKNVFVSKYLEKKRPPKSFFLKYNIVKKKIEGRNVFILSKRGSLNSKGILYLHGGAFMANLLSMHWRYVEKILKLENADLIVPDYPLAPKYTYKDGFKMLGSLNRDILSKYREVEYIGDSAGAGLCLSFSMYLRNNRMKLPCKITLISPWLDLSMTNREIGSVEDLDPILSKEALTIAAKLWSDGIDLKSWEISPIYGDFSNLPPITLYTGTHDILNPDARLLKDRVTYKEYRGMIHNWLLF